MIEIELKLILTKTGLKRIASYLSYGRRKFYKQAKNETLRIARSDSNERGLCVLILSKLPSNSRNSFKNFHRQFQFKIIEISHY